MVEFSDNIKLSLLFGIAIALVITLSVLIAVDANNDNGLDTAFCNNFPISDDEVRQIFADSFRTNEIFVVNLELQCLPEQIFDKVSDEDIEDLETNAFFSISIRAPLVAVHPDAFKTTIDLGRITSFTLDDSQDGNIIETGDNFLAPFFNLLTVTLTTASTSISDTLVGNVTTIQSLTVSGSIEELPGFISNQINLQQLNFLGTLVEEIQIDLFEGLERLSDDSVTLSPMPSNELSLTESDVADFYGTDTDHLGSFRFLNDNCDVDQDIRRDMRGNVHFDSDRDTTVLSLITNCFPNDIFREFSDEELFLLFPQDRDTSFLVTSPLLDILSGIENIFDGPDGLFDRVTSVTFQGSEFFTFRLERMFEKFIALEEVVFREIRLFNDNVLNTDLIGEPCQSVTKTFRLLNSLDFTSFPTILSFCPLIETLDFTGCSNFVGNGAELLNDLENLNEIILTNTALDIEQEGNVEAIAGILGVSPDIIVIN